MKTMNRTTIPRRRFLGAVGAAVASVGTKALVAAQASLFDCRQFVTWSGSYSSRFGSEDRRNRTAEAVAQLHRAIREVVVPVLEPIKGWVENQLRGSL